MKKALIVIFSLVIILTLGAFGYIYYNISKIPKDTTINRKMTVTYTNGKPIVEDPVVLKKNSIPTATDGLGIVKEEKEKLQQISNGNVKNILVMGIDSADGYGRSDALMIISVNKNTKMIKISSIQRDSYVYVPGYDMTKINHAYSYGGPALAIRTVNTNFGLDIEDYVSVDFYTMPQIIDRLGGISLNLSAAEARTVGVGSSAGNYYLTGQQALNYSRIRYLDSDYVRTSRQRYVAETLIRTMMNTSPADIPGLISEILPLTRTSLDSGEILDLGLTVVTGGYDIEQRGFPDESYGYGSMIGDTYFIVFDRDTFIEDIQNFIYN